MGNQEFAAWLRDRLAERGMSGSSFARRLGVSLSLVSAWLHGQESPAAPDIPRIADALGVVIRDVQQALPVGVA